MSTHRAYHNLVRVLLFGMILLSGSSLSTTDEPQTARVISDDGTEISFRHYPGDRQTLFIWLPSEHGIQPAGQDTAAALAMAGHETWLVDIFESRFLPPTASSLDRIPAADIRRLIDAAEPQQRRRVFLISSGRGALPLLRGLHDWQTQNPTRTQTPKVILLSPEFYYQTPDPGRAAQLLPVVEQTNAPIFILQPAKSPWRWKLDQTIPALEQGGSDVFYRLLPDVRDRFHFRPDATQTEQQLEQQLPDLIRQAALALQQWPDRPRSVNPLHTELEPLPVSKKERELKPYAGDPMPPTLQLPGLDNNAYDLDDYRGQVVLVNFWASWCPPCVHEMPSMERLQNRLQDKPFTILAVNMAEDKHTIRDFLQNKVNVTFPILLDRDGKALKEWDVFAFPTSYLVDKQGNIRYALFGSVDWERPEIFAKIEGLLNE